MMKKVNKSKMVKKQGNYLKLNGITCGLGNGKLDKSILIFNLPSIKTCPNNKDCKDTCYARKFEKLYPTVLPCRERNYQASFKSSFIDDMVAIITRAIDYGVKAVRVHESGDFYSAIYAQIWEAISDKFPTIKFYAYTKSQFFPISDNFNIVKSILPDNSINYGSKEEVIKLAKKYHAVICPATKLKSKDICGNKCKACFTKEYVLFIKH